jgi:hypothetical protein
MNYSLSRGILLFLLLGACQAQGPEMVDEPAREFRATPPSRLFFKNMRANYYELLAAPSSQVDVYRLRRFAHTELRPIIYALIVDDWLREQAYLRLQTNDFAGGFAEPLQVFWHGESDSGRHVLPQATWEAQRMFALELYAHLRRGERMEVLAADSARLPVFEQKTDRAAYITTIRDYLRLTENDVNF